MKKLLTLLAIASVTALIAVGCGPAEETGKETGGATTAGSDSKMEGGTAGTTGGENKMEGGTAGTTGGEKKDESATTGH